jgi:hypothetical protein
MEHGLIKMILNIGCIFQNYHRRKIMGGNWDSNEPIKWNTVNHSKPEGEIMDQSKKADGIKYLVFDENHLCPWKEDLFDSKEQAIDAIFETDELEDELLNTVGISVDDFKNLNDYPRLEEYLTSVGYTLQERIEKEMVVTFKLKVSMPPDADEEYMTEELESYSAYEFLGNEDLIVHDTDWDRTEVKDIEI